MNDEELQAHLLVHTNSNNDKDYLEKNETVLEELVEASFLYALLLLFIVPIQAYVIHPPHILFASCFFLFYASLVNLLLATYAYISGVESMKWLRVSFGINVIIWLIITMLDSTFCLFIYGSHRLDSIKSDDMKFRCLSVIAVLGGLIHCIVWSYCFILTQRCLSASNNNQ